MKAQLEQIRQQAVQAVTNAIGERDIEDLRVKYLGKKGELTAILKQMGGLSAEERPQIGQLANQAREYIEQAIAQRAEQIKKQSREKQLISETIDVTMPGKFHAMGKKHPLSIVLDEIKEIFLGMGFEVAEGPEVELDYYNFEALNITKNHPARDTQDTFYITEDVVLRTQTSPV